MANGAVLPPPQGQGGDGRGGAGLWAWTRPIAIGLLLALVLLVLLAGLLNDLLPGSGGGVISGPTQTPTPSVSVLPTSTESPVPTDTATDGGTGEGGGTGGDTGGGGTGGTGGSTGGGGGSNGGGGGDSTAIPTPSRTGVPTPTITPPVPPDYPVGPMRCTVRTPPGYCFTRQTLIATVTAGRVSLTNTLGEPQFGRTAALVKLAPGGSVGSPSVAGELPPVMLSDFRGADAGWTLKADVAWPGGLPEGVVVTVDPWCRVADLDAAPGISGGHPQSLGSSVTMCTKDSSRGVGGSTSGVYIVGGQVTLSTWVGTPIPATAVLVTLSVS